MKDFACVRFLLIVGGTRAWLENLGARKREQVSHRSCKGERETEVSGKWGWWMLVAYFLGVSEHLMVDDGGKIRQVGCHGKLVDWEVWD